MTVLAVTLPSAIPAGASASASTFTVAGFGDGSGFCTTPDASGNSVCPTLRAAVVQASKQANGPTIDLLPGTYQLTAGNGGELDLRASINIVGAGAGGPGGTTIEQTDGQSRVLQVDGSTNLTGLEVTGGDLGPASCALGVCRGGGILVEGTLVLQNVLVTRNQVIGPGGSATYDTAMGGGIAYDQGSAAGSQLLESTVSDNKATGGAGGTNGGGGSADGGGISYEGTGPLLVQASTIAHNDAVGGDDGPSSPPQLEGEGRGGGIFNSSDLTVSASTIAGNVAHGGAPPSPAFSGGIADGGGVFTDQSVDKLTNSTVFGNAAQGGAWPGANPSGPGYGGGITLSRLGAGGVLQSDTIDANQASTAGSNLELFTGDPPNLAVYDTIVAGGQPASVSSCDFNTTLLSESVNLEDDATGQCGFSSSHDDLVGVNPELPTGLADNGGPTQTLAPAPGSPALAHGSVCRDYSHTPYGLLAVDQRGQPRSRPCDIGAFEAQPPSNATRPAVSGTAALRQTLICSDGIWSGDGPLDLSFQWLRNGDPIPGALTNTYVLGPGDPGQGLACRVTASRYGSLTVTSRFVVATSYPRVTLLKVSTHDGFVVVSLGCRGVGGQRCSGTVVLTAAEPQRARAVTLLRRRYGVAARHVATLHLRLNRAVVRLLSHVGQIPATASVRQTTAAGTTSIAARRLKLRRPSATAGLRAA
jgi:hypothetical protein